MNERISPITTSRDGNKITKVCVEDYYKMINRIARAEERSAEKWNEIWDSMGEDNTCLITGIGISQPNMQDAFDEEIYKVDNLIAFDLDNMRTNYNPGYLPKLDGYGYKIQEEEEQ